MAEAPVTPAAAGTADPAAAPAAEHPGHPLRAAAVTVAVTLALLLAVQLLLVRMFAIPSASMEPTLRPGDRVAVDLLVPGPLELRRGDVVVFRDARGWLAGAEAVHADPLHAAVAALGLGTQEGHLVKRVVGLPGDRVRWSPEDARLEVNGVPVDEPYVAGPAAQEAFDVVVPDGGLWVLGDHRSASQDSRQHQHGPGGGMVSVDDVVGRVEGVVWPLDRAGAVGPGPLAELP